MPGLFVLIKPVSGLCDLQCDYCFYRDETEKRSCASYGKMKLETLEKVIEKALGYAEGVCTFAFQGGEPFLRGIDFYKQVLEFQKRYNKNNVKIENAIQTNGCSFDTAWACFLAENNFLVGISLDGIRRTNDKCRKDQNGNGSFDRIMQALSLCDRCGVEYNLLTVVNRYTAGQVKKIYQFYKKHCFEYLQFIPCLDPLGEVPGQHEYSLTPEAYGNFLNELFDLWYSDVKTGEQPYIRQFENILGMMLGIAPEACDQKGICGMQYVVEADGAVYPCDFYVLDDWRLGNLTEDSFEEIDQKRKESGFIEMSKCFSEVCRVCEFFWICRGGCRRHRQLNDAGEFQNYFCQAYREFFRRTLSRWKLLAEYLQGNHVNVIK